MAVVLGYYSWGKVSIPVLCLHLAPHAELTSNPIAGVLLFCPSFAIYYYLWLQLARANTSLEAHYSTYLALLIIRRLLNQSSNKCVGLYESSSG